MQGRLEFGLQLCQATKQVTNSGTSALEAQSRTVIAAWASSKLTLTRLLWMLERMALRRSCRDAVQGRCAQAPGWGTRRDSEVPTRASTRVPTTCHLRTF